MQCKEGMVVDDVIKYKKYHYDEQYDIDDGCEFFPVSDSKLKENIKNKVSKSNCIVSDRSCMYIIGKNSGFMNQFLVAEVTKKSSKYADSIHHEELSKYYKEWVKWFIPMILKVILVSVGVTAVLAIILLLIYYKGVIYVIYGNKKK